MILLSDMEGNISIDKINVESNIGEDNLDPDSTHKIKEKDEEESEQRKAESLFENEINEILEKIKNLPLEAEELKEVSVANNPKAIYSKLCKVLNVTENSAFHSQIETEKMDYSYQSVGYDGIIPVTKALATGKMVKKLDLKYNALGAKSLPAIASLIDQNECIQHLNLASNDVGKGSSSILSELLSRCFSVEFLDLSNNNLGDEELHEIGMSLMKIDSVKELNLSKNDFSFAKAPQFASCISKCSALLKLDFSCCHLQEGASSIFSALKFLNITVLKVTRNGVPNESMQALASGLRANKSLQELDVSYNVISNKGALSLAPGLKGSSTLEIIRLAHNPIQGSAATKLLSSAGSSLKLLDLSGIKVDVAFFKTLRNYAKTGRDIRVLFGSDIRYDFFPRELTVVDGESLSKDNIMSYLEGLAEEKGVSLRNTLKNIHASFIADQHAKLAEEKAADTKDAKASSKDAKKSPKDAKKSPKDAKASPEDVKTSPTDAKESPGEKEMPREELAKRLANSAIAVPKTVVLEVADLLSEEGFVNMWNLIAKVRWKPDDLFVKIKEPKKPPPDDKKKEKGKAKK